MLGRESADAALGSEAVDADFLALVCQDEELLNAEFDAILSGPTETPRWVTHRPFMVDAARPPGGYGPGGRGPVPAARIGDRPERHLLRERSPPTT